MLAPAVSSAHAPEKLRPGDGSSAYAEALASGPTEARLIGRYHIIAAHKVAICLLSKILTKLLDNRLVKPAIFWLLLTKKLKNTIVV